jgi:hypothetical protein
MKFTLQKKSVGKVLTVFNVLDGRGGVCGSVNVPNKEAPDFVKCWRGPYTPATKPAGPNPMAKALLAAKRPRTPSEARQAALRGS